MPGLNKSTPSFTVGWFNHYYTKSTQEFSTKNSRGDAVRAKDAGRKYTSGEPCRFLSICVYHMKPEMI